MTSPKETFAVQKHLEIMQGVIQRMAENSRSCKVWCITLVSAVLILVARTGEPNHALICPNTYGAVVLAGCVLLGVGTKFPAILRQIRRQAPPGTDNPVEPLHCGPYGLDTEGDLSGHVQLLLGTAVFMGWSSSPCYLPGVASCNSKQNYGFQDSQTQSLH